MELISVILKPRLTEKTQGLKMSSQPKLSFVVNKNSNKNQIAYAFYSLFGIKASSVNTVIKKPQPSRFTKYSRKNFYKTMKIAYISVSLEDVNKLQDVIQQQQLSLTPQTEEKSDTTNEEVNN